MVSYVFGVTDGMAVCADSFFVRRVGTRLTEISAIYQQTDVRFTSLRQGRAGLRFNQRGVDRIDEAIHVYVLTEI